MRQKPPSVRVLRQVPAKWGRGGELRLNPESSALAAVSGPLFRFAGEDLPPSTGSGLRLGGRELVVGSLGFGAFSAARRAAPAPRGEGSPARPVPFTAGFSEPGKDPGIESFILPRLGILDSPEKGKRKH